MKRIFEPLSMIEVETNNYGVDITVDHGDGGNAQTASIDWRRLPEIASLLNEIVRQGQGGQSNG